ncbi:hypothetical protein [Streptomyces brasiliensis]|uniref:Uncharacterized protein n=1 Tax=Streptomyces brasiliensis TaxID=1954 RepID=A0A917L7B1_9ACTN|nr:hypothetical protein [Streptomyces brasiliensis]GGJ43995.1 hypothetical protein GCM10010121_064010 [Streptomyces brasiliensis]
MRPPWSSAAPAATASSFAEEGDHDGTPVAATRGHRRRHRRQGTAAKADQDNDFDDRGGDAALARSARTELADAVDAALAKVDGSSTSGDNDED